ncbi:uncharacterized protein B0I36DRAFT_129692 [Microdochium trichocladiopsis]|uniref:Uncharacterized protein n=1 Tax=Microdochium trichocladiopsis TaxID=1682393 RepID=A0A9P8Y6D8_9PEZI|nr:uncharacterized protein B0I36DRAFT_129692 [Microdochium trichocladiopsis]KAH7029233.1 hypothetical protein B0I36DRAFT_129692 [Microdochium trichocladiopsis]
MQARARGWRPRNARKRAGHMRGWWHSGRCCGRGQAGTYATGTCRATSPLRARQMAPALAPLSLSLEDLPYQYPLVLPASLPQPLSLSLFFSWYSPSCLLPTPRTAQPSANWPFHQQLTILWQHEHRVQRHIGTVCRQSPPERLTRLAWTLQRCCLNSWSMSALAHRRTTTLSSQDSTVAPASRA